MMKKHKKSKSSNIVNFKEGFRWGSWRFQKQTGPRLGTFFVFSSEGHLGVYQPKSKTTCVKIIERLSTHLTESSSKIVFV